MAGRRAKIFAKNKVGAPKMQQRNNRDVIGQETGPQKNRNDEGVTWRIPEEDQVATKDINQLINSLPY